MCVCSITLNAQTLEATKVPVYGYCKDYQDHAEAGLACYHWIFKVEGHASGKVEVPEFDRIDHHHCNIRHPLSSKPIWVAGVILEISNHFDADGLLVQTPRLSSILVFQQNTVSFDGDKLKVQSVKVHDIPEAWYRLHRIFPRPLQPIPVIANQSSSTWLRSVNSVPINLQRINHTEREMAYIVEKISTGTECQTTGDYHESYNAICDLYNVEPTVFLSHPKLLPLWIAEEYSDEVKKRQSQWNEQVRSVFVP